MRLHPVAQRDEDASKVADQPDLDDGRQLDLPDAANTLHVVVAVLVELFAVVVQAKQMQPFVDRLRPAGRIHLVQRSFQQHGRLHQQPAVFWIQHANLQQAGIISDAIALFSFQ